MNPETRFWTYLRAHWPTEKGWWVKRIEDSAGSGTPDVFYSYRGRAGWIELKILPAWPKRPESNVTLPTLTMDQVAWALGALQAGVSLWWLIKVQGTGDFILFDPAVFLFDEKGEWAYTRRTYDKQFWLNNAIILGPPSDLILYRLFTVLRKGTGR